VSEFVALDPGRASEIREFLSALLLVEAFKPEADDTVHAGQPDLAGTGPGIERLGDFRILRELGRGGMGIVYEAEQESLGRHVALKVLFPGIARSPQHARRFEREARAAARLHHTNIVPVFGVGEHDGLQYYAMQFIPGLGLDKVLDEVRRLKGRSRPALGDSSMTRRADQTTPSGLVSVSSTSRCDEPPQPSDQAGDSPNLRPSALAIATDSNALYARRVARIGLQVAEALEYAHQQGTLHRDVKPSNILLDVHGVAWLTDFGLAKATEDEDLTRTGDLVGTIRYMAPERFRCLADARSDVYGLGLTLYELLALRPAFGDSDHERLLYQVNHVMPTRLRHVNPAVPRDLDTIVHKAIEKDAAHRYATAAALAEDLRRFLEDRPIVARRVGSTERLTRWARRNPGLATLGTALAATLALVVVVIAAADLRLRREHADTLFHLHRAERAEADAESKLLDSSIDHARASRRSRFAGRRFEGLRVIGEAARLDTSGSRRLELRNQVIACLTLPDLRPLAPWPGRAEDGWLGVDFDPTSGRVARGTPDGAVLFRDGDGRGEPARLPGNGLRAVFVRFSPDGRYLAVKHVGAGRRVLAAWNVRRGVKVLEVPDGMYRDAVDFHPDSRTLAAGRRDGSIVLYDLAGDRPPRLLEPGTVPRVLRFDPSGDRIAVVGPFAREGVQVRLVADGSVAAAWSLPEPMYAVDWQPDGGRLAAGTEDGRIWLLDPADPSRAPRTFGGHDGQVMSLAFHPGGAMLASASWDGTVRLWDARAGRELVKGRLPDARPIRFSRDGRLLGPGHDTGSSWLWEVAEGAECRSLVGRDGEGAEFRSVVFLDEGRVLVSAGGAGLRLESPDGEGTPAFVALPGTSGMAVAPDGSFLLTSGATGLLHWPVLRLPPGELRIGPPRPLGPLADIPTGLVRISGDGQTVAAVLDGDRGRVLVLDRQGRVPAVELAGHPILERLALSPDGRWVATGAWQGIGVKVWDARGGAPARGLPVGGCAEVVFSPDGRRLLTASGTEYAAWEVGTWVKRLRIPRSGNGGMPGVATFSPDGRLLAIERTRSVVQLVEAATGKDLATLEPPDQQNVTGLGFSPDGRVLVATLNAPRTLVWDLGAIRRGLATLGLDWATTAEGAPVAPQRSGPLRIVVEDAPWLEPLRRGEAAARSGRWEEAASAFERAIACGAPFVMASARRVLVLRALGDEAAYREACRQILRRFDLKRAPPSVVNELVWSCALGPGAVEDYSPLIDLTWSAAASQPEPHILNTLGALLYRAGRFEEAVRQLDRAVEARGAIATDYDAPFLAMAHRRLGHAEEARRWLRRDTAPAPFAMSRADASLDNPWTRRLEVEILSREATAVVGP
jgi:serine/threonine protein kinase/WD40 repeat protein